MTIRPRLNGKSAFSRDAWLEIDLNAIEYNYQQIRGQLSANTKLMAVVKSDAYGHGASTIAPLLEACGVDYFGVASVDEGIQLRDAKVKQEILILSPIPVWALGQALMHNLQITVSSLEQIKELEKLIKPRFRPISLQVKINTGMNRSGAKWNKMACNLIEYILQKPDLFSLKGVYSHLACHGNSFFSQVQADRFKKVIDEFEPEKLGLKHLSASSALDCPDLHFDMVRIGLSMYNLRPALSLIARISQLQALDEGEAIGYNLTWTAEKDSLIALLPLGYADGIKRGLSNRLRGLYEGEFIKQVGTISMDQMSFDVSDFRAKIKVGDKITLLGGASQEPKIETNEWAQILGTIIYEITCDLRARLPRIYTRKEII